MAARPQETEVSRPPVSPALANLLDTVHYNDPGWPDLDRPADPSFLDADTDDPEGDDGPPTPPPDPSEVP